MTHHHRAATCRGVALSTFRAHRPLPKGMALHARTEDGQGRVVQSPSVVHRESISK